MDVVHPVQINLPVILWRETDVAFLHDFDSALGQRRNLDEPLRREPGLDNRAGAIALADRDGVILRAHQKALRREIFDDPCAGCEAIQPRVGSGIRVHPGVLIEHFDLRQIVAQASLKIVGIMSRRHLHRAGAEFGLR